MRSPEKRTGRLAMGFLERISAATRSGNALERRFSADQYLDLLSQSQFSYNGISYLLGQSGFTQAMGNGRIAEIANSLPAYLAAVRSAPPVFAAQMVRALVLSQARFTFRNLPSAGQPRRTFGTRALSILERPGPSMTTGELLARMEWHAGLAGNAYVVRRPPDRPGGLPRLRVLRPDWVAVVFGSKSEPEDAPSALDAQLLGFVYWNGGPGGGNKPITLLPEDVAHWAPLPDPEAAHIGMSWITPALREIQGDRASTEHKLQFFANGAVPGLVVKGITGTNGQPLTKTQFDEAVDMMEARHAGIGGAYRTLYLTAGADATVIGADLKQIDFTAVQGRSETRIAFLSRVPAALLGISEGLAGSSLNAGNFGMARRIFADSWVYPTLQDLAGSLGDIVDVPKDAELWFDTSDMPILREDSKDAAEIEQVKASTIVSLATGGFTRKSSIAAVTAQDMTLLQEDPNWVSVQLQQSGGGAPGAPVAPGAGDGGPKAQAARAVDGAPPLRGIVTGERKFSPTQPRDDHGRWAKQLGAMIARGIAETIQLSDPDTNLNDVSRVAFNGGGEAIRKVLTTDGPGVASVTAAVHTLDAEELAAPIAQILGLRAPRVYRAGPTEAYYSVVPRGKLGVEIEDMSRRELISLLKDLDADLDEIGVDEIDGDELSEADLADWVKITLAETDDGLRMGLLDLLVGNVDRNSGNWFADGPELIPIDHGMAWQPPYYGDDGRPLPLSMVGNPFVHDFERGRAGGGEEFDRNSLSREYIESLKPKLAALRPAFEQLGHPEWHDYTMAMLEMIAERAKGDRSL